MGNVMKTYKVKSVPTTIVFDAHMKSQVTLTGATFKDIEQIFEVRDRLSNGLPKGLKIKCGICD